MYIHTINHLFDIRSYKNSFGDARWHEMLIDFVTILTMLPSGRLMHAINGLAFQAAIFYCKSIVLGAFGIYRIVRSYL
jgi:hypothetical protein